MSSWRARRRVAYGLAVAVLAALAVVDPGGLRKYLALSRDAERMRSQNAALAADNGRLAREVHALRTDPAALERAVREELRYIRPGERVYVLDAPQGRP
ncbi:MAG TPA: septum formation initiator family protein [Anaeromyxobacter sp.]|nr:septum formation initiator family protein [Anaeromyxobacter sp.]